MTPTRAEIEAAERWDSEHPPVPWWFGAHQEPWWSRVKRIIYEMRTARSEMTMTREKIEILELAVQPGRRGTVWANVYTRMSPDSMRELIADGYLTIVEDRYSAGVDAFGGMAYYMAPDVGITDKGREFLRTQMVGVGEW